MPQRKSPEMRSVDEANALVVGNLALAGWFVVRFFRGREAMLRQFGEDDAVQVCLMAMMKAARLWDETRAKFTTYVCRAMLHDLWQAVGRDGVISHPPALSRKTAETRGKAMAASRTVRLHIREEDDGEPGPGTVHEHLLATDDSPTPLEVEEMRSKLRRMSRVALSSMDRANHQVAKLNLNLAGSGCNQQNAADQLGITRTTFGNRLRAGRKQALAGLLAAGYTADDL